MSLIRKAYFGSDPKVTLDAMGELVKCDLNGKLAYYLFRAQKASTRAKRYCGGRDTGEGFQSFRSLAYQRKSESLMALTNFLEESGGESCGWGRDSRGGPHSWVLYVDLPGGQVSFHSGHRGPGRDYDGRWDGQGQSQERILVFCEEVLAEASKVEQKAKT